MINKLMSFLEAYQVTCSQKQLNQFEQYYRVLLDWNQKMNLTAITDKEEVFMKHFFDSITPAFHYSFNSQKIIDIGAGAGFPGLPLKICFPDLELTLLDSLNKRITFLHDVVNQLGLEHVNLIHGRAEEIARNDQYRESFDIAISRAVARLNVLVELSLPFVHRDGMMIALKGVHQINEEKEAKRVIGLLGGNLVQKVHFELPDQFGQRTIFFIQKEKDTPKKYPRKPGIPNRKPIV